MHYYVLIYTFSKFDATILEKFKNAKERKRILHGAFHLKTLEIEAVRHGNDFKFVI